MRTFPIATIILIALAGTSRADDDHVTGEAQVRDAATIAIAGARFRLDALAAAENQTCGGRPCADAAVEVIGPKLAGRPVTCVKERRLGHGYFLARCKLDDGSDLATLVLEEGLALAEPNAPGSYREAAERAKSQGKGLWGQ